MSEPIRLPTRYQLYGQDVASISVSLPRETIGQLREEAARQQCSVSLVVSDAVARYLAALADERRLGA